MRPEIVARQALEKLAQRARQRRQLGCALAVGEQQRAVAVAHMHRPDAVDRVEPGAFLDVEAEPRKFGLHGGDGGFERGILARDEAFCVHGDVLLSDSLFGVEILATLCCEHGEM